MDRVFIFLLGRVTLSLVAVATAPHSQPRWGSNPKMGCVVLPNAMGVASQIDLHPILSHLFGPRGRGVWAENGAASWWAKPSASNRGSEEHRKRCSHPGLCVDPAARHSSLLLSFLQVSLYSLVFWPILFLHEAVECVAKHTRFRLFSSFPHPFFSLLFLASPPPFFFSLCFAWVFFPPSDYFSPKNFPIPH